MHKITYSEQHFTLHFFQIFPFKDFLLVNHNLLYTILRGRGTGEAGEASASPDFRG